MNIEQTKEAIAVMQAYVDGKEVQVRGLPPDSFWMMASSPCWDWLNSTFRIKPTATLRPWTSDEVPLGAWMRNMTNSEYRWLINTSSLDDTRKAWLQQCEHSTDGGKTWLPCGVVEESK
jgi:hypothetical protein